MNSEPAEIIDKFDEPSEMISGEKLAALFRDACAERLRMKISTGPEQYPFYGKMVQTNNSQIYVVELGAEALVDLPVDTLVQIAFPLDTRDYYRGDSIFQGRKADKSTVTRFMIAKPLSLYRVANRRTKRVVPSSSLPATCLAISGRKTGGLVQVKNISPEGVCLTFPTRANVRIGDRMSGIKLKLHGSNYLSLEGTVRHKHVDNMGRFCIGLMWESLTTDQFVILQTYCKFVYERQLKRAEKQ